MSTQPGAPPLLFIAITTRSGGRQHFYHFMLGVLVPLAHYFAATGESDVPIILQDCGPMNPILHELNLSRLMLAEPAAFINLANSLPNQVARKLTIQGYDIGFRTTAGYDTDGRIQTGANWLLARRQDAITEVRTKLQAQWLERPRVLVIERAPPDPFYSTIRSKNPTSGAARRKIANHREMATQLTRTFPGARNVRLEGQPLAAQIAMFQLADIVVAQHGAALANVMWMRPEATAIEISRPGREHPYFSGLAAVTGRQHHLFLHEADDAPVDVPRLVATVGDIAGGLRLAG